MSSLRGNSSRSKFEPIDRRPIESISAESDSKEHHDPAAHNQKKASTDSNDREWYVKALNGSVYGPATSDEIVAWISEGRVVIGSKVRDSESKHWQRAEDVFSELKRKTAISKVDAAKVDAARVGEVKPPTMVINDDVDADVAIPLPSTRGGYQPRISHYSSPSEESKRKPGVRTIVVLTILGLVTTCPVLTIIAIVNSLTELDLMGKGKVKREGYFWIFGSMIIAILHLLFVFGLFINQR